MSAERELTRNEKAAIRKLVTGLCANYDKEYGCLPLESECYMLNKTWTGAYCKYFAEAVLPNDPALTASLSERGTSRPCGFCGTPFSAQGKQAYCSSVCAGKGQRRKQREYMRKKRRDC